MGLARQVRCNGQRLKELSGINKRSKSLNALGSGLEMNPVSFGL